MTFTPVTDPVAGSVAVSALIGLIPLVVFFVLLAVVRTKAHVAGAFALLAALVVAVAAYRMPLGLAGLAASQGAVFGAFPVFWIVLMAVWLYQVTVVSGRFEDLRRIFDRIGGGDVRIQAVLIAFCFGGLMEALAGFGAPVAITATMLMAIGIKPLRAAATVLVANTAPVAFGAIAIPITTAGSLTGIPAAHIGAIVGRQTPLLAFAVPLLLLLIVDGWRGLRDAWAPALVTGVTFGLAQFLCSNYFSYELTDVVASLVGLGVAILFLRVWTPRGAEAARARLGGVRPAMAGPGATEKALSAPRVWLALFPYLLVVVVFGAANLWRLGVDLPKALASTNIAVPWPVLHSAVVAADGKPLSSTVYSFQWLSSPGTLLFLCGLAVAAVYSFNDGGGRYRVTVAGALGELWRTAVKMRFAALTIMLVLALAYVMNLSGQTVAIGTWLAGTGAAFAFLSPILGWIGTAVTGSDTSSNALFAKLQQTAGHAAGINPDLLVAANTAGGVVGKLISPQNLAIAATSVGMDGQESTILRKVLWWSLGLLLVLCTLVFLQSTPVLGWMLP
ncbi:lactate permease [Sinomonas atrocyanea]|uniref:L-lactate permease n=1 Tax=Sinomonas atrocyanea TaxID=37927 RepID=A0A127A516_9MICC|nr:L-lactate permease [Sinomonas atrocyanea]AMM34186.1 lactate permease [Sinomonas atrocyanea]GEB64869.1 lactate transporter LctP family protein [Sinomonas atrocyanea]GGG75159.1 lactate transporter LctP family protein [Sinomonas atrocyanea]